MNINRAFQISLLNSLFISHFKQISVAKATKLSYYHANVSDYHQFIEYLEEKQLVFTLKSKLTPV